MQSLKMIHWWWNLHNCHRHSCCGLFCSRYNGTIKQVRSRRRSRKLLWTASILGACWPGKLWENVSGWLFQAFENVSWQQQSHSTIQKCVTCCSEIRLRKWSCVWFYPAVLKQEMTRRSTSKSSPARYNCFKATWNRLVSSLWPWLLRSLLSWMVTSPFPLPRIHVHSFQLECTDCAMNQFFTQGFEYFQLSWPEIHYNWASLQQSRGQWRNDVFFWLGSATHKDSAAPLHSSRCDSGSSGFPTWLQCTAALTPGSTYLPGSQSQANMPGALRDQRLSLCSYRFLCLMSRPV